MIELAQLLYHLDDLVAYVINLFFRVEPAKAEADRGMCQVIAGSESFQNVQLRFECRRGTGRAAGNRDIVDSHQQALALGVGKADVQIVGQTALHRAVDVDARRDSVISVIFNLSRRKLRRFDSSGISRLADFTSRDQGRRYLGTFSVPERMPRSCPPPSICAVIWTRGLRRRT